VRLWNIQNHRSLSTNKKHASHTHIATITARIIEVDYSHPLALTNTSETGTANVCHPSVGSVVSTPLRGNGNDLSCSVQAADGGVSNVQSVNDVLSVPPKLAMNLSLPHIMVRKVVNLISLIW